MTRYAVRAGPGRRQCQPPPPVRRGSLSRWEMFLGHVGSQGCEHGNLLGRVPWASEKPLTHPDLRAPRFLALGSIDEMHIILLDARFRSEARRTGRPADGGNRLSRA